MLEQILNINLPKEYKEGIIEYTPTLDGIGGFELKRMGVDENKIKKMIILCEIERMKFLIKEPNDFTTEELEYAKKRINEEIKNYNSIKLS